MKIKSIGLFLLLTVLSISSKSADFYVDENGSQGYSSIIAAVNACSNGDRIFITPKSSGDPYDMGNTIEIHRDSIELISTVVNERYSIASSLQLFGNSNHISGALFNFGGVEISGNDNIISNCKFTNCPLVVKDGFHGACFYQDSLYNSPVSGGFIRCAGNYFECTSGGYSLVNFYNNVQFVGNTVVCIGQNSQIVFSLLDTSLNVRDTFLFSNNYFHYVRSDNIFFYYGNNSIDSLQTVLMDNNTFQLDASQINDNFMFIGSDYNSSNLKVNFKFNSCIFNTSAMKLEFTWYYGTPFNIESKYCFYSASSISNNILADSTNTLGANIVVNSDGSLPSGSPAINGGDVSAIHTDIDLTRNDAGCFGGSYSMANFRSNGNNAVVTFMSAPRVLIGNSNLNFSVDAISK